MSEKFPDYETYEELYAKYLDKGFSNLLDGVSLRGKVVADLCCGGGRIAEHVLENGAAHVACVDVSEAMLKGVERRLENYSRARYGIYNESVADFCSNDELCDTFDLVVCQQAINYWFNGDVLSNLYEMMRTGSMFVFNTFNTRPGGIPVVREYDYNGRTYVEVVSCVNDIVYHYQSGAQLPSHSTTFKWIEPDTFRMVLNDIFPQVSDSVDGNTTVYTCYK